MSEEGRRSESAVAVDVAARTLIRIMAQPAIADPSPEDPEEERYDCFLCLFNPEDPEEERYDCFLCLFNPEDPEEERYDCFLCLFYPEDPEEERYDCFLCLFTPRIYDSFLTVSRNCKAIDVFLL